MQLIVGLGNPGPKYDKTRHNIGFEAVDKLFELGRFDAWRLWKKAQVARGMLDGHEILLVKPQTFMNLSGEAVGPIARYYKVLPQDVLVLHDELDFALGRVQIKPGGGHGGHNGLRNIILHIGPDFPRIRMGIGRSGSQKSSVVDYVLAPFDATSEQRVAQCVELTCEGVALFVDKGLQHAMNHINRAK